MKAEVHERKERKPSISSTDNSITSNTIDYLDSTDHNDKKDRRLSKNKNRDNNKKRIDRRESDFFIEVVIDELKRENADLRATLRQRDQQIKDTAEKVNI